VNSLVGLPRTTSLTDELSDTALQIVAEANTNPGNDLLFEICRRLAREDWPPPERVRRWLLIVTDSPGTNYTNSLLASMLGGSALADDPDTALFLFDYLTEPKVKPSHGFFGATFEAASRDDDTTLRDIWEHVFRPALGDYAVRLLDMPIATCAEQICNSPLRMSQTVNGQAPGGTRSRSSAITNSEVL